MRSKIFFLSSIISLCIIFCFVACGQNEKIQSFALEENPIGYLSVPENLPHIVENYDEWTRECEWMKVSESRNVSVYAKADDDNHLYVYWNDCFGKCNWENARSLESDLKIEEQDIDEDGEKEVLIIQYNNTGSGSGEEELHVLDQCDDEIFKDTVVPISAFWEWTKKVVSDVAGSEEIDDLYLYTTSLNEDGITIRAEIDTVPMHRFADIKVQFVWKKGNLQVKRYEIES